MLGAGPAGCRRLGGDRLRAVSEPPPAFRKRADEAPAASEYFVIFEQADDGGWGAYLPDLPGVVALGDSRLEVENRIREALQTYADEMRSLGQDLPEPVHTAGIVQA